MSGSNPRAVAAAAIGRVADGGRATVVLAAELERSDLSERDRAFATALTLGTVRMQRACNHLLAPHLRRAPDRFVGGVLRHFAGFFGLFGSQSPVDATDEDRQDDQDCQPRES